MEWHQFVFRLGLALLLGSAIRAEGQWRQRMAGLHTNGLVASGAAMFVMVTALTTATPDDSFRIAGQVASGIGFLGAGVILRQGLNVTGLYTAATLWCSAAIGVLAGYGLTLAAVIGAVFVVAANILLRPIGLATNRGKGATEVEVEYVFRITTQPDQEAHLRVLLLNSINGEALLLKSLKSDDAEGQKANIQAVLSSTGRQNLALEKIASRLSLKPSVSGVSWELVSEHE